MVDAMSEAITRRSASAQAHESRCRRIRVMVVDDSPTARQFLLGIIEQDPRLELAAAVESGERALEELEEAHPDVISMDICLPGMDGFEATRRIMTERATPIVVVAAEAKQSDRRISLNALQAGALSVLAKPHDGSPEALKAFAERLCTQLAIMSQVRVVTQRHGRRPPPAPIRPTCAFRNDGGHRFQRDIVGIAASTGGPNALLEILRTLVPQLSVPVLIVQHMTASFMGAFIQWLADACGAAVVEAAAGVRPQTGRIYVAPADLHLTIRAGRLHLDDGPVVAMQRPSGSVLFESMAQEYGAAAIGVLLTGMGVDGASGLHAIRAAGGYTIAEDESTAVVYGMPGAAVAMDAACESLALPEIAPRLLQLTRRCGERIA